MCGILFFLSLISLGSVWGETIAVEKAILDKYVHNNALKYWHSYIRGILSALLQRVPSVKLSCPVENYKYALRFSCVFTRVRNEKGKIWLKSLHTCTGCFNGSNAVIAKAFLNATYPMGMLPSVEAEVLYEGNYYAVNKYTLISEFPCLKFQLHHLFRTNLSLFDVYFSVSEVQNCFYNYIQIASILVERKSKENYCGAYDKVLRYCGLYDKLTCYPESSVANVQFIAGTFVILKARIFYSIIYYNRITSSEKSERYLSLLPNWKIFFAVDEVFLSVYHLKVHHHEQVVLSAPSQFAEHMEVYDGPGSKCKKIQNFESTRNTQLFLSATFQVTMHFLSTLFEQTSSFSISSSKTRISDQFVTNSVSQVNLKFPSSSFCLQDSLLCVIQIETEINSTINITLSSFEYQGDNNPEHCEYSGVALYDVNDGSYQHVHTECIKNHFSREAKTGRQGHEKGRPIVDIFSFQYSLPNYFDSQSIYSKDNTLILVHYYYKEYGFLGVVVSASATTCKVTTKDLCRNRNYMKPSWEEPCLIVQTKRILAPLHETCKMYLERKHSDKTPKVMSITGSGIINGKFWVSLLIIRD